MRKVIFTLFFTLILCGVSQAKNNNVIEPELQTILNQKSDDKINISIVFKSQANSAQLMAKAERNRSISKRDFLVAELKEFSIQTQNDVFAILQAEEKNGKVKSRIFDSFKAVIAFCDYRLFFSYLTQILRHSNLQSQITYGADEASGLSYSAFTFW